MTTPSMFIFGLGFSATRLARALLAEGWTVAGTCRSAESQAKLEAMGITVYRFDRNQPLVDAAALLGQFTHMLISTPPDERGDPVIAMQGAVLADLRRLEWVGYLSTTGVYGNTNGDWVSEAAWLRPTSPRQRHRVEAERSWMALYRQYGLPLHLFRLSGIYGPGRSAIDQVRAGTARRVDKPGQVFCRIHVDDIVAVLRASMARPSPGAIYNLADDLPSPSHEVVAYACTLLNMPELPLIPFDQADLSPMAASFYADCRRVKNERIKRQLGVTLLHPDYRSGLAAQLLEQNADS